MISGDLNEEQKKWSRRNKKISKSGVKRQSQKVWAEPKATDEGLKHQPAREQCGLHQSFPVVRLWLGCGYQSSSWKEQFLDPGSWTSASENWGQTQIPESKPQ